MKVILFFTFLILTLLFSCAQTSNVINTGRLEELKQKAIFINNLNTTWKASHEYVPAKISLGAILDFNGIDLDFQHSNYKISEIPESFDVRENWPECQEITTHVRDQGPCGSCWAVAATSVISDRICIHSKGETKVMISAEDLLSCCTFRDGCGFGCGGGYPSGAFKYWVKKGIVSGGDYNDETTCRPYSFPECSHNKDGSRPECSASAKTPKCERSCVNGADYNEDLHFGSKSYKISSSVKDIQNEIMQNGPVEAAFIVYDDFPLYKTGVYQKTSGARKVGGHAVKIMGWGVENDTPYWLVANSWNEEWGEQGFFKILRGENHCGFENLIVSGLPKL